MPRKPTGRPRGRQLGSGALGLGTQDEHTRLTLRIPNDLYTRLEAFAEGRAYTRGTPHLARCVRDAIEHYLACPNKRQTSSVPPLSVHTWQTSNRTQEAEDNIRQTSNCAEVCEDNIGQTSKVPAKALGTLEHDKWQTSNVLEEDTEEIKHDNWQTSNTAHPRPLDAADLDARPRASVAIAQQSAEPALDYDRTKYTLGRLCPRNHEHGTTGQSLLQRSNRKCLRCHREQGRTRRETKRQAGQLDAPAMATPAPAVSPRGSVVGDKASVLAQLDAWKAAGVSLQTMADRLNTSAVPTFSGKGTWKKGTIGNLLAEKRQAAPVA